MIHKFNFYYDFIYPLLCKIVGKEYSCCQKIKNCKKCCVNKNEEIIEE